MCGEKYKPCSVIELWKRQLTVHDFDKHFQLEDEGRINDQKMKTLQSALGIMTQKKTNTMEKRTDVLAGGM